MNRQGVIDANVEYGGGQCMLAGLVNTSKQGYVLLGGLGVIVQ